MILRDEKIVTTIIKYINSKKDIKRYFDFSYKSQKHKIYDQLVEIIKVIKYGTPWRTIDKIPWNTVYSTYKRLLKLNIIKETYKELLKQYYKKTPNRKLKIQITDTTCVKNRCGSDFVKYNGYKKMKCTKVSFITDINGIPISVLVSNGTKCDSRVLLEQLMYNFLIDNNLNDKNKNIILADSLYDCKDVIDKLVSLGYTPIIAINKRNTKFKKIRKLTQKEKEKYKKRIYIEHTNNKFKNHRRCICRYDRFIEAFYGSIYISLIDSVLNVL